MALGKAEVIVGRDIEGAGATTGKDLGVVVVGGDTVEENDGAASYASHRLIEALVQTSFETAGIERIKV